MTYELSREHEEFRRSVREFAQAEIAPHAAQWDKDHHFPVDVVQQMGKLGLFGLTSPEEFGGAGEDGDFTSLCVAIEEIGRVDQSMGITLEAAVGLGINPILTYGTDEQKQTWLPDLVAGQTLAGLRADRAGCRAPTPARRRPRPRSVDGQWVVNGAKQFITNSGSDITSVVTVTARTGRARGRQGGDQHDPGAVRHRRVHRRAGLRQARLARLRHPPADLPGLPGPRGQPARRARPRVRPVPGHAGRRPGRDRRPGGRLHPGLRRPERRVRPGPADLRRPDRPQAGRRLPGRRPRGDAAREPSADLPGGRDEGRRRARSRSSSRLPRSPSCTPPSRR